MTRPSERIWAHLDDLEDQGLPPRGTARVDNPMTVARTAARVGSGVSLRAAVADFLDDLRFAIDSDDAARRIASEPERIDGHTDAYFGAVAEHVALQWGIPAPPWCRHPARFLDHFWWPSSVVGLRARAIVESPAAFRRRGIFIGATTLVRV